MTAQASPSNATMTILVVDDNTMSRKMVQYPLEKDGHKVLSASCGEEALAIIESDPVRLIFLDVFMDPMSGLDVLAAIKTNVRFQDISVVMISGSEDPDIREKCIAAGAGDLLPKPVTAAALRKIVSDVMDTPDVASDHKGVSGGQ